MAITSEHPRLFVTTADIEELRRRVSGSAPRADAYQRGVWAEIRRRAERMLEGAPTELVASAADAEEHGWGVNLHQARRAQDVIVWCAFAQLLTGRAQYAERARREISAVLAWESWVDPVHLPLTADLMTGELCFGLGIAYDWLHGVLSEDERDGMREGLVGMGLLPYLRAVEEGAFWARCSHNWNAVVNCGCAVGAMALLGEWEGAEECLDVAGGKLDEFFDAIPADGGWGEGVGYWRYGMHYAMCYAAALRGALGSDDEIILRDGVRNTGYFPIYMTAPDGLAANFGDCSTRVPGTPVMHYLSMRTGRREFGRFRRERQLAGRAHPFDLVWAVGEGEHQRELPRSACFGETGWAALRSSGDDGDALYVAIKSGDLKANHSHLDLNSFILVAGGERFVVDPGPSRYSKEYFGPRRWEHYEASTRAHSTIVIDGRNQDTGATGEITDFFAAQRYASVTADASAAYGDAASDVRRHFVMIGEGAGAYLVMLDEVALCGDAEVEWLLHTEFPVEANGATARLCGEEGDLWVEVLVPEGATLDVTDGRQRQIGLRMDGKAGPVQVLAMLQPVGKGESPASVRAISGDNCRGVELQREGVRDRLLMRTSAEGEVEAEGVYFDGQKAFVREAEGALQGAVLENGVSLAVERQFLLGAERAVSAAVDLSGRESEGVVRARCWASGRTGLSFSVWAYPETVRVNRSEVEIDAVGGMVSVVLETEGDHDVEVRLPIERR